MPNILVPQSLQLPNYGPGASTVAPSSINIAPGATVGTVIAPITATYKNALATMS